MKFESNVIELEAHDKKEEEEEDTWINEIELVYEDME